MPKKEMIVKLFGTQFVQKNKSNAYIKLYDEVKNEEYKYELIDYINITRLPEYKYNLKTFKIILVQTDYFIDLSCLLL